MHKLMYLMPRLETVEAMAATLRDMHVGDEAYRVISRDEDGIRRHRLRDATLLDHTDLVHLGERGALVGAASGMVLAALLLVMQPFGVPIGWLAFLVVTLLVGLFGAWVGGMAGLSHEHYKLAPFHEALAQGQYLVVIGMRDAHRIGAVRQAMLLRHPEAIFMADDDTLTNPLASRPEYPMHHAR